MNLPKSLQPTTVLSENNIDILRTVLLGNVFKSLLVDLIGSKVPLPEGMNSNVLQQTVDQFDRFTREVKRTMGDTETFFDYKPKWNKVVDMSSIVETMARIGIENTTEFYDNFLGSVIDCIDSVLYAQDKRARMFVPKYKKLFELIAAEIKADANKEQGQIQYYKGELHFRSVPPVHEPKIDE